MPFRFIDIGRVWEKEDHSNIWHNSFGAGVYFSPAQMALLQFAGMDGTIGEDVLHKGNDSMTGAIA
jgi:hypothetical protein